MSVSVTVTVTGKGASDLEYGVCCSKGCYLIQSAMTCGGDGEFMLGMEVGGEDEDEDENES